MLERFDKLVKYGLNAADKEVGKIADLYFDDAFWTVRYLVVDTGNWLVGRTVVLISPYAVASFDPENREIDTTLTAEQIENSPSPESNLPVSRQFEFAYSLYYGYPHYWNGPYAWGGYTIPELMPPAEEIQEKEGWDSHLQSAKEVEGYEVDALGEHVGHIVDFVVDDADWTIRYFVVDTRNWWPGKHVLLSPAWVEHIDWAMRTVSVDVSREMIREAPEYHEDQPITREYEIELLDHYCKECYWGA